MPFNDEKQCVGEDQPSDADSSRLSESTASLSDCECSRQSFTSDSSSKSSSPACKLTGAQGRGQWGGAALCAGCQSAPRGLRPHCCGSVGGVWAQELEGCGDWGVQGLRGSVSLAHRCFSPSLPAL